MRFLTTLSTSILVLSSVAVADITSAATTATGDVAVPTPAASSAAPVASAMGYAYVGCYNETTGLPGTGGARALKDGQMQSNKTQTVESCLTFCAGNKYTYCGMEYGSECWGSRYFSTLSAKLDEKNCSIGCAGNNSQLCGGMLTITLYNKTEDASSSGSGSGSGSGGTTGAGAKEVAGAITAVVLAGVMGLAFSMF